MAWIHDNKVYTHDPGKRTTENPSGVVHAGSIIGTDFVRHVEHVHFFNNCNGYGMQCDVAKLLLVRKTSGITNRVILITPRGDALVSDPDDWFGPGSMRNDFGHGDQQFLPVRKMQRTNGDEL